MFEDAFAYYIGRTFYFVGLDHWHANSKIALWWLGVLIPAMIPVFFFIRIVIIGEKDVGKKIHDD